MSTIDKTDTITVSSVIITTTAAVSHANQPGESLIIEA